MSTRNASRWATLFDEHDSGLRGFFRRRRVHRDDADDLVQEVYARLLRSTGGDSGEVRDPEAYLYTVAANLQREHAVREKASTVQMRDISDYENMLTCGDHPEALLVRDERRRLVKRMLEQLPDSTRDVLILQHRDGLSYKEIAEKLGISIHMVKKHVVTGMARCRLAASGKEGP